MSTLNIDSKLFFGTTLGRASPIVEHLSKYYNLKTRTDLIDKVNQINTHLPKGVWLEITYPIRDCEESDMIAHLSLLDDNDSFSPKQIKKAIRKANYGQYGYVLSVLDLPYTKPKFYTEHYIYNEI